MRLAALVASDAPEASYLVNLSAALDTELDLEDAQSVLIAVAPIVGTAKVIKAAGRLADALDLGIAIIEEEAFEEAVAAEAEAEAELSARSAALNGGRPASVSAPAVGLGEQQR